MCTPIMAALHAEQPWATQPTFPPPVGMRTKMSLPDSVALMICSWWFLRTRPWQFVHTE